MENNYAVAWISVPASVIKNTWTVTKFRVTSEQFNQTATREWLRLWDTESLKDFEMKPLLIFSCSPQDKNFRGFPYE